MTPQAERALAAVLRDMIIERQRLLVREANYLRGLVGLPPVRAEKRETALDQPQGEAYPARQLRGPGSGGAKENGNDR